MTRVPPVFRIPDLRRAVKAITEAGHVLDRVEIDREGRITVYPARGEVKAA